MRPVSACILLACCAPGLFPGLCDALNGTSNILIEHMDVTERALDVGMVHRPA